jgi:hypothetical protein
MKLFFIMAVSFVGQALYFDDARIMIQIRLPRQALSHFNPIVEPQPHGWPLPSRRCGYPHMYFSAGLLTAEMMAKL